MAGTPKGNRRKKVWEKANGLCAHCGRKAGSASQTIDHFVPKSFGGTYDKRNLMPLCSRCNKKRDTEDIDPGKYYKYAKPEAIRQCRAYYREWKRNQSGMQGFSWAFGTT